MTRAYDDGAPADTPTTVYRQFTVTTTPHGRDRWTGASVTYTDYLTLTRTRTGWQITAMQDEQ